jgi:hypothetical protein
MIGKIVIAVLLVGAVFGSAFGQDMDSLLKPPLDTLYKADAPALVVSFGAFTYSDQRLASPFSQYLADNLALAMKNCPQFELFAREKLEEILEAQELSLQDLFSQKDPVRLGQLKAVKAVVSGRFFDAGRNIEVFLDLVSVETGAALGNAKTSILKSKVPTTVKLLPDNYQSAVATMDRIQKVAVGDSADLDIKVWTKRGDGGVYRDGEELDIHFLSTTDCFIKLYHISAAGEAQLIFPNQQHMDNRVTGNKFYSIPEENAGFAFLLGKPYGTEFIKAVASSVQFRSIEEPFTPLGKATRGMITRGLPSTAGGQTVKEAMVSYTIIGK